MTGRVRFLALVLVVFVSSIMMGSGLKGRVIDKMTGQPLGDVNLLLEGTGLGASTNGLGEYHLDNVPVGRYKLVVSHIGFEKFARTLNVKKDEDLVINVELMPTARIGDAIVTTATRRPTMLKDVPEIVMLATEEEIRSVTPMMTSDVLQYLPGISVEAGTNSGQPFKKYVTIDGLPAQYSLILMDGTRIVSSHWHTGANVNVIPPEHIESIEVVKGASSAQYGSDGIGGVLNIITKKPHDRPRFLYSAYAGSQNTFITNLSYQGFVNEKTRISSFVGWEQSDGARIIAPVNRLDQFDYSKFKMMNRVETDITHRLNLGAQIYYLNTHFPYKGDDPFESWLYSPKVDMRYIATEDIEVNASVYYTDWQSERQNEKNQITEPEITVGYKGIQNNYLLVGGQYKHHNFRRRAVEETSQSSVGFFIQDEWTGFNNISLLGAIRFEKPEGIDLVVSPKLTTKYDLGEHTAVRLSMGRGFRAPSVQDLNETFFRHGGSVHYRTGNPDLKPEYSTSLNAGIETDIIDRLVVVVNGYYTSINDLITPVDKGLEDPRVYFDEADIPDDIVDSLIYMYRRENIHRATIYGGEVRLSWNLFDGYFVDGAFNYTHNRNEDTDRSLPYYPGSSISTRLRGRQKINHWLSMRGFVGLNMVMNRKTWSYRIDGTEQEEILPDYQKLDAGLNFLVRDRFELFLRADNLLGQEITTHEDATMVLEGVSTFMGGIRISFE